MSENLDLSGAFEKIQGMLSTSDGQEQIQGLLSAFMNGGNESESSSDAICDNKSNSSNVSRDNQNGILDGLSGLSGGITPDMLFKIQRIMTLLNNNKPEVGVEFLRCLKPLLKESRRERVDKAVKMITLIKAMEILRKEGGI